MRWPLPRRCRPAPNPLSHAGDRPFFDFQLRRLLGEAPLGGANVAEVAAAVQEIGPSPSAQAWVRAFAALGRDSARQAADMTAADPDGAAATALRAANYLRAAEFFIEPLGASLDSKIALYREMRRSFAIGTRGQRIEAVQIQLYDAVRAPKALHIVPSGRPGSAHCQADHIPAAWEVMIPWLLDQLTT